MWKTSLERELWSALSSPGWSGGDYESRAEGNLQNQSIPEAPSSCAGRRGDQAAMAGRWDEVSHLGPPQSSICPTDADHNLYIFKGSHYWVVTASGNASNPQPLQPRWPGLPPSIDACTWSQLSGKFYFFKGR